MKAQVGAFAARVLTSEFRRRTLHARAEVKRRMTGQPRTLVYFHQVSDPYSHLMVQVLPAFAARFGLRVQAHVVGRIDPDMLPEPDMFHAYGLRDALALAELYDLDFPATAQVRDNSVADAAGAHLAAIPTKQFCDAALRIGSEYWSGTYSPDAPAPDGWSDTADAKLTKMGHYLPGTIWFGGEWYWGLDRLDHLERRLIAIGLGAGPVQFDRTYARVFDPVSRMPHADEPPLEMFFSARSPYTYIALFQARKFADALGLRLVIHPVLPMVMRNLKVPFAKRLYIVTDAKREATKAGLLFGNIADPLGPGIERTYAVAYWIAQSDPSGLERFFRSAMQGMASEGIDLATDTGLETVTTRAGFDWHQARAALSDQSWRAWVASNRETMTDLGLWGVPGLRYGDVNAWGQDRFWVIRQAVLGADPNM